MSNNRDRLINLVGKEIHNTEKLSTELSNEQISTLAARLVDNVILQLDYNLLVGKNINNEVAETTNNNAYLHSCTCPICNNYITRGYDERTFYCENCGTKLHQSAFSQEEINHALFEIEMDSFEDD